MTYDPQTEREWVRGLPTWLLALTAPPAIIVVALAMGLAAGAWEAAGIMAENVKALAIVVRGRRELREARRRGEP